MGLARNREGRHCLGHVVPRLRPNIFPGGSISRMRLRMACHREDCRSRLQGMSLRKFDRGRRLLRVPRRRRCFITISLESIARLGTCVQRGRSREVVTKLVCVSGCSRIVRDIRRIERSLLITLVSHGVGGCVKSMSNVMGGLRGSGCFVMLQGSTCGGLGRSGFSLLRRMGRIGVNGSESTALDVNLKLGATACTLDCRCTHITVSLTLTENKSRTIVGSYGKVACFNNGGRRATGGAQIGTHIGTRTLQRFVIAESGIVIVNRGVTSPSSFNTYVNVCHTTMDLRGGTRVIVGRIAKSIHPLCSRVLRDPTCRSSVFVASRRTLSCISSGTVIVIMSAGGPRVARYPRLLGESGVVTILSRRERDDGVVRGTMLSCIRPCSSSAYRVVTRILRCVMSSVGFPTLRTRYVCTKVVVSAEGFVGHANIEAFRTTTFLEEYNTSVAQMHGVFHSSVTSCRTGTRTIHGTRICHGRCTVTMYPDSVSDPAILTTRTTGRLLSVDKVGTSFMLARCRGGVCVDTHSVSRIGIRVVTRGLNKNNRVGSTKTRFSRAGVRRTIDTLGRAVSGVVRRKSV